MIRIFRGLSDRWCLCRVCLWRALFSLCRNAFIYAFRLLIGREALTLLRPDLKRVQDVKARGIHRNSLGMGARTYSREHQANEWVKQAFHRFFHVHERSGQSAE